MYILEVLMVSVQFQTLLLPGQWLSSGANLMAFIPNILIKCL